MKRVDEARLIKVDSPAAGLMPTSGPPGSAIPISIPMSTGSSAATIVNTTIFPTQMPQQPLPNSAANFTRVISHGVGGGVSVYREGGGVAITAVPATSAPPLAHGGMTTMQPMPPHLHQTPVNSAMVTQPPSNIKPEPIALPTTPVSVHYATTTFASNPSTVKTFTTSAGSVQSLVHSLQQQQQQQSHAHHQQMAHQKSAHQTVTYGPPGIRTISAASLPTVPNAAATAAAAANAAAHNAAATAAAAAAMGGGQGNAQFQRLKVEDALSYLDQVKYKFGNQPQVYNDFLDIMKEFKSQSIDTPGVIAGVSCLFKGHPELIVGFNTFLPPGYKIEVQCNEALQISMPGILGAGMQTIVHTPHGIHTMGAHGHMSALLPQSSIGSSGLTSRPMPIQLPSQQTMQQVIQQQNAPKFNASQMIKSENLLPQQPAPAHLQASPYAGGPPSLHPPPPPMHMNNSNNNSASAANSQPVEFNHAINYVNKIKNRFQGQPDVYKQFLEILHTYQKDQKAIKEGQPTSGKFLTEAEVYAKVSKLFQNQEDLLSEFGQFLPEATNDQAQSAIMSGKARKPSSGGLKPYNANMGMMAAGGVLGGGVKFGLGGGMQPGGGLQGKRPPSGITHPPPKKQKLGVLRDVSLAEAGKYGTLNEFAFFDKVRKALRSPEVYDNFLRCLVLFNQEVISRQELVQLTSTFLHKHPDLFKWFKDFVGLKDGQITAGGRLEPTVMPVQPPIPGRERMSGDSAMEVDYATCKRLGASYCALPKTFTQPKCSGRTTLCREVLNDTWVSFPSWSEDSQFVTSRKTQYEEFIYRTEDERFEFDVVLETNKDTIKVLECVQKKMSRMPPEEAARYKLDDCLGGSSPTIHQRAIRRIYGDKANDIIDGLKRNPVVAVPLVLRRLKAKDEEWRDVQKNFNKVWRDQNEKYYLKSLDHQGILFKQTDARSLRSKSLLNEIEAIYDERHEQDDHSGGGGAAHDDASSSGPHLTLEYEDTSILEDANNLLIHHVKRQTSIHKEDKHKIKVLLRQFLLDLFKHPRQDLSDDEKEDVEEDEKEEPDQDSDEKDANGPKTTRSERAKKKREEKKDKDNNGKEGVKKEKEITEADVKPSLHKDGRRTPPHARDMLPDESYSHMMCNNNWYIFLRLHHILCERLSKMYNQAVIIANEESSEKKERKESTAIALRLKPKSEIDPEDYYPAFLDMVKNALDGNMEAQAYEDTLREMFGIHAYISFTLDKVISNAVRQLQHLVSDEAAVECHDLFLGEAKSNAVGGSCSSAYDRLIPELIYQKKAEKMLVDENCMKVFIYHQSQKMTIEMLDTESESQNSDHDDETTRKWHSYIERFIQPGEAVSDECKEHLTKKPVFLPRGIRSYRKSPFGKMKLHNQLKGGVDVASSTPPPPPRVKKPRKEPRTNEEEMMEDDDDDEDRSDNTDGGNESETKDTDNDPKSNRLRLFPNNGVIHEDNTQCQFNPRTLKILYVINSENCFYRRQALNRAKESHKKVSRRKTGDFNRWHSTWLDSHVTDSQHGFVSDWFLGRTDGLVPNKTTKVIRNDLDKTPYRMMVKYRAEILKQSVAAVATPAAAAPAAAVTTTSGSSATTTSTPVTSGPAAATATPLSTAAAAT